MGQAKKRGTFQQRQAEAVERERVEAIADAKREAERKVQMAERRRQREAEAASRLPAGHKPPRYSAFGRRHTMSAAMAIAIMAATAVTAQE